MSGLAPSFPMVIRDPQCICASHPGNEPKDSVDEEPQQREKKDQPRKERVEFPDLFDRGGLVESLCDESESDHRPTTSGD
jgi:hypothetical protein